MMWIAPVMSRFSAVVRFASSSPGRSPAYVSRSVRSHCPDGIARASVRDMYCFDGRFAPQVTRPSAIFQNR